MESVAINAVGANGVSVIAIDVLRKDLPNQPVSFSNPFVIGQLHHVLVQLVQGTISLVDMYRFHCPFPTCVTGLGTGPVSHAKDSI
jgi:hypothetical protein